MSKHLDALYEAAQKATMDTLGCDSGPTAVWCRVCGTCTCPHPWDQDENTKYDPNCPLHASSSDHADDDAVRGRARAALAAMVEENPQAVMALVEVARKGRKWKHWRGSVGGFPAQYRREAEDELAAAIEKVEGLG